MSYFFLNSISISTGLNEMHCYRVDFCPPVCGSSDLRLAPDGYWLHSSIIFYLLVSCYHPTLGRRAFGHRRFLFNARKKDQDSVPRCWSTVPAAPLRKTRPINNLGPRFVSRRRPLSCPPDLSGPRGARPNGSAVMSTMYPPWELRTAFGDRQRASVETIWTGFWVCCAEMLWKPQVLRDGEVACTSFVGVE